MALKASCTVHSLLIAAALLLTPLWLPATPARADDSVTLPLTGPTKIEHEFSPPLQLDPQGVLTITGTNSSSAPISLGLRVDDSKAVNYDNRYGEEHAIPPGPFTLQSKLANWKTPSGRVPDVKDIRQIILFAIDSPQPLDISTVTVSSVTGSSVTVSSGGAAPAPVAAPANAGKPFFTLPISGPTKIEKEFGTPLALDPGLILTLTGNNANTAPVHFAIRVDDGQSKDYGSRYGEEHTVPPGPFSLETALANWKTPSGRLLDVRDIRQIVIFTLDDGPSLDITRVVEAPPGAALPPPVASAAPTPAAAPAAPSGPLVSGVLPLKGRTKIDHEFAPSLHFDRNQEITITGENATGSPVDIGLRIDDGNSVDYNSRFGEERTVPPGPFRLRTSPGQWRSPLGHPPNLNDIRRIIIFTLNGSPPVEISEVSVGASFALPNGSLGWKFGAPGSAVFPGFEPIIPGDQRIGGSSQVAMNRPGGDALLASGIRGVEKFTVPLANGPWHVSLWTDDLGEWEYVPHPLVRKIIVNGKTVEDFHYQPMDWVKNVYLADFNKEAIADGDPWSVFGQRRGGLITTDVMVTDGQLVIEQSGDMLEASYLAAVLAEPGTSGTALEAVQNARHERFKDRWPVDGMPTAPPYTGKLAAAVLPENAVLDPNWRPADADHAPDPIAVLRGGTAILDLAAISGTEQKTVTVKVLSPQLNGETLEGQLRWGQWRYMFRSKTGMLLTPVADHLRGDLENLTLRAGLPRRLNLMIPIPEHVAAGRYQGSVTLVASDQTQIIPIAIDVLPPVLPAADRPVGLYFFDPPYYDWFKASDETRDRALQCDLVLMGRLGLTGIAPQLVTPVAGKAERFAHQLEMIADSGINQPIFAYEPIKKLIEAVGVDQITAPLVEVGHALDAKALPAPIWSIADEPGNPGTMPDDLAKSRRAILAALPTARIAGQLNHVKDRDILSLFDVVLLNDGFAPDADEITGMINHGIEPWLYNMPNIDYAAGFYLWRSGARGYLQWNARAPAADPYDPTDGREPDHLLLPITTQSCRDVPDIDAQLLQMVRGIDDLKSLLWLDARAAQDPDAKTLRDKIHDAIPGTWRQGQPMLINAPALRAAIRDYARNHP